MLIVGVTASFFGLGATLSNFFGQMVVEKFDHVTSLMASFFISLVPVILFLFMPETLGMRTHHQKQSSPTKKAQHHQPINIDNGTSYGAC